MLNGSRHNKALVLKAVGMPDDNNTGLPLVWGGVVT